VVFQSPKKISPPHQTWQCQAAFVFGKPVAGGFCIRGNVGASPIPRRNRAPNNAAIPWKWRRQRKATLQIMVLMMPTRRTPKRSRSSPKAVAATRKASCKRLTGNRTSPRKFQMSLAARPAKQKDSRDQNNLPAPRIQGVGRSPIFSAARRARLLSPCRLWSSKNSARGSPEEAASQFHPKALRVSHNRNLHVCPFHAFCSRSFRFACRVATPCSLGGTALVQLNHCFKNSRLTKRCPRS